MILFTSERVRDKDRKRKRERERDREREILKWTCSDLTN